MGIIKLTLKERKNIIVGKHYYVRRNVSYHAFVDKEIVRVVSRLSDRSYNCTNRSGSTQYIIAEDLEEII